MSATPPDARLAAGVEASAFLRLAEQQGGFGAVLHKGDAERGTLLLAVNQRGVPIACLARQLGGDGQYRWSQVSPGESDWPDFLKRRVRNDPDEWQIELDIPLAERFIAETTGLG